MKRIVLFAIVTLMLTSLPERATPSAMVEAQAPQARSQDDQALFLGAARTAWNYGQRYYRPNTGFVAAVPFYDYTTVWDLGSSLAILYCARELGFLPESAYKARISTALQSGN